ncbi:MAG: Rossmann-like and DUF2520 domain-containing protein [Acidimicrobiia bacterium]
MTRRVALVGPGRAGGALCLALRRGGDRVVAVAGRSPDAPSTQATAQLLGAPVVEVEAAGVGADLVVLAPPDARLVDVARVVAASIETDALVVHLSGAQGLGALASIAEQRTDVAIGALHPLQSLPSAEAGADRLAGSWAAVAGDARVTVLAADLGLRPFAVADEHRARYHAAACVASNHLVALLAQVGRLAAAAGVPEEAFQPLVRATVEHALAIGPAAALTGPISRGDIGTVAAHLAAIPDDERRAYRALADAARVLAGHDDPALVDLLAAETAP